MKMFKINPMILDTSSEDSPDDEAAPAAWNWPMKRGKLEVEEYEMFPATKKVDMGARKKNDLESDDEVRRSSSEYIASGRVTL